MSTLIAILNIITGLGVILLVIFTTYIIGKMFSIYILRKKEIHFFTNVFFGIGFIIVMFFILLITYRIGEEVINKL